MSWSRLAPLLLLAACGFSPVYGPGGAAEGLYGQIAVAPPRDEPGYLFVRHLEERLGLPDAPLYRLDAEIALDETGLGVTPDQEITRIQIAGEATYTLTDLATGAVLQSGEARSFTSYSAPVFSEQRNSIAGNAVTVRAAESDAVERLMTILGDQIVSRLLATAPDWR
ncbi:LPS-assembly lipoprotein [Palleronia aestuarii]|uniref:LPS-assembly lipoprotein n=1 Tax=Palleronia aestuarii TaxID=568105 RepID=A0A2W7NEJ7_9RHOB|nr:LPS assembly lipoprotein LptE [Palleronia aestuarii]PZX18855.1 LPS-assembly lipoprotein [Palleronia aestuarii]